MKRKIACLLSLTMILSSMSINAFADSNTDLDTLSDSAESQGASSTVTVNNIDMTKFRIVLPTTKSLNFIADPQGLAQLSDGGSQEISNLTGGKVYSDGDVTIANRSSVDVKVTATVNVTESGTDTKVGLASADGIAGDSSGKAKISLAAVVSEPDFEVTDKTNGVAADNQLTGYTVKTTTKSTANDKNGYAVDADAKKVEIPVTLKKAEYVASDTTQSGASTKSYDYTVVTDSVGGAVTFSLAGTCTTQGWDKIKAADMPTVKTKYVFANATSDNTTFAASSKIKVTGSTNVSNLQTAPVIVTGMTGLAVVADKATFKIGANANEQKALAAAFNDETTKADFAVKKDGTTVTSGITANEEDGTFTITGTFTIGTEYKISVEYDGKRYIGKAKADYEAATGATIAADTSSAVVTVGEGVELNNSDAITLKSVKVNNAAVDDATVASVSGATFTLGNVTLTDAADKPISVEFVYNNKAYTVSGTVSRVYEAETLASGKVTATKETITANLGEDVTTVATVSVKIGDEAAVTIAQAGYALEDGILTITAEDAELEIPAATAVVVTVTSDATSKKYTGSATTPTDLTSATLVSATQLNIVVPGVTHVANKVTALSVGGDSITFTPTLSKDGSQIKLAIASGAVNVGDSILVTYDGKVYAGTVVSA